VKEDDHSEIPMTNLQRRLRKLEDILTDPAGLAPHTRKWLEYWDRQFYLYMTGQDRNAIWLSSIEAYRAVMKFAGEDASSLVRRVLCENNSQTAPTA
jgi:hypothetical protein